MTQDEAPRQQSPVLIPIGRGLSALVDAGDAELVAGKKWHAVPGKRGTYYAQSSDGTLLHRVIAEARRGVLVDHIDGDGLNNCRNNLRLCSNSQNMANQRAREGTSSRFKGVTLRKRSGRWSVTIEKNGRFAYLGEYTDECAAARQYDRAARLMFGRFAKTNEMLGLLPPRSATK